MRIRVEDIPSEGKDVQFEVELGPFNKRLHGDGGKVEDSTYNCEISPKVDLRVESSGRTIIVSGYSSATIKGICGKCAEETEFSIETPVKMILKPKGQKLEDDDVQLSYYDAHEIDLSPIVEEQLILAIPLTIRCSVDCKGLCPKCGQNLNLQSCSCKLEGGGVFTPLSALKEKLR